MPYCTVGSYREPNTGDEAVAHNESVQIYYQTYGHGDIKVLLVMGLAATLEAWNGQILSLVGSTTPNEEVDVVERLSTSSSDSQSLQGLVNLDNTQQRSSTVEGIEMSPVGIHVCAFDNRGVGKSSSPRKKSEYSTTIMAMDALALMDHLGWEKAHVFGHSLGAMISCKLAAMFPERIASLALLSATGGGYECIPKLNWVLVSLAFRFMKAKSPEDRARVDLDTHYTRDYLEEIVGEMSRRRQLLKEYVKSISASDMQSDHGQSGQLNACWTHRVTPEDYERLLTSSILVSVIHGRGDVIAQYRHGRSIFERLRPVARLTELPGGHLVTHQHTKEVNQALLDLIQAAEANLHYSEWQRGFHDDEEVEGEADVEDAQSCGELFKRGYRCLACGGTSMWRRVYNCLPMRGSKHNVAILLN